MDGVTPWNNTNSRIERNEKIQKIQKMLLLPVTFNWLILGIAIALATGTFLLFVLRYAGGDQSIIKRSEEKIYTNKTKKSQKQKTR